MLTGQDIENFENAIREKLRERKRELSITDERLGRLAFPYMPYPRTKVSAILTGQGRPGQRKPQTLHLTDVLLLCEALGLSWQTVIRDAFKNIKK